MTVKEAWKPMDSLEFLILFFPSLPRGGEDNGNPFQCSCLENPMDGGAW